MIGSFFKKIGLSIAMLCSSMTSVFHKPKSIKKKQDNPVRVEQVVEQETKSNVDIISDFVITPTKSRDKTHEEIIHDLERDIEILKKNKKDLKEKIQEEQLKIIKEEQKKLMDEIDARLAKRSKTPEKWEVAAVCFLTDDQVRAIIPDGIDIKKMKSIDEDNDIFV